MTVSYIGFLTEYSLFLSNQFTFEKISLFCERINSKNSYGYYLYLRKPHAKSKIVNFCLHSKGVVLF